MNTEKTHISFAALLLLAFGFFTFSFGGPMNHPLLENVLLTGRWQVSPQALTASAPGVMVQFAATTKELSFDLEGEARYRLDIDGKTAEYFVIDARETHKVKVQGEGVHQFRLIKVSESNPGKINLYGIDLGKGGKFGPKPKASNRRIEFIGDSYSVGYGNEANGPEDGTVFEKTNASKSYAFLLADGYKADFQINAVSGRGLVRNYDGIVPDWPLSRLYDYTVFGAAEQGESELWNFETFHPQVIVIFVGINDFQGNPPYADPAAFKATYNALLAKLRKLHPGVKFLLVSTKTWPNDAMTPAVQQVFEDQQAKGFKDLEYKLVQTENTALHGHPSAHSQEELAQTLRFTVGRLGGFLSR